MRRVGFLYFGSRESAVATRRHQSFLDGMRTHGYVAGRDFALEERFADGKRELLRVHAEELARMKPDAVVAGGSPAVSEMRRASATIPIVVAIMGGDPVRDGYAGSLARPGGNVTGVYTSNAELLSIQIELLAKVAPAVKRIAALFNPSNPVHPGLIEVVQAAARKAGAQVTVVKSSTPQQIDEAFEEMKRAGAGGLVVLGDTFFTQQSRQLAGLALRNRVPMVSTTREYVDAGGLFSYGEDARENFRLAAGYVDKILRGAKAGDLAFSRSQRPYLVVNRKTFSTLGLTVPQELAARADEVIQ
jgi:putative tryptophan/tyrosine transport system substrate-binding protein